MSGSYDFEEQERIAELKGWWEDNRWYVIGAIAAAVLAFAGFRGWHYWSIRQADDAGAMYAAALKGPKEQQLAAFDTLVVKHPGSFFASQAQLVAAKARFEAGDYPEARKRLEWVMQKGVDEHRGVARLRLAAVFLEEKKYPEALKTLDDNKDEAFAALAADLRGDIMLAQGRIDEARASYKTASEKADPRNPVKQIAETKLNALGGAQ
jgi:predicted negative regulator of RcsB-dependent stress response